MSPPGMGQKRTRSGPGQHEEWARSAPGVGQAHHSIHYFIKRTSALAPKRVDMSNMIFEIPRQPARLGMTFRIDLYK